MAYHLLLKSTLRILNFFPNYQTPFRLIEAERFPCATVSLGDTVAARMCVIDARPYRGLCLENDRHLRGTGRLEC